MNMSTALTFEMHYRSTNVTRLNITISAAPREFTCTSHILLTRAYGVVPEAAAGPRFTKNLTTNRNRISYLLAFSYVYDLS